MQVTVIVPDKCIIVDGDMIEPVEFDYDEGVHAIQWDGADGHIEFIMADGGIMTTPVSQLEVQPYVEAWQAAKDKLTNVPPLTLAEAKTAKQAEIRDAHNAFLLERGVEYSDMERQTWDTQRLEAQALLADPQATAPLVRAIANARSMEVLELAQRIQMNTQAWSVLAGHATGQRLAFQDALEACSTVEQVEAISISFTTLE